MSFLSSDSAGPFFRFVMEVTTWIWLFLAFLQAQLPSAQDVAVILLIFSMGSLALLNYPGDKRPVEEGVIGLAVPGKLRVILEVITATLGLLFGALLLGVYGAILQLIITFMYFRFDTKRLSWMWGWQKFPPDYVTKMHNLRKKEAKTEKPEKPEKKERWKTQSGRRR